MDVQSMFIGMTKADCFVHEKDPTDIVIDIIEFSVPEDMEEGTFKYIFQLWSGTTVIGPEVSVTSPKAGETTIEPRAELEINNYQTKTYVLP